MQPIRPRISLRVSRFMAAMYSAKYAPQRNRYASENASSNPESPKCGTASTAATAPTMANRIPRPAGQSRLNARRRIASTPAITRIASTAKSFMRNGACLPAESAMGIRPRFPTTSRNSATRSASAVTFVGRLREFFVQCQTGTRHARAAQCVHRVDQCAAFELASLRREEHSPPCTESAPRSRSNRADRSPQLPVHGRADFPSRSRFARRPTHLRPHRAESRELF